MKTTRVILASTSILVGHALSGPVALAGATGTEPDAVTESDSSAPPPLERPWLYAGDARPAAPLQALALSRFTYTSTDSVTRPFASNVGTPGAMFELGGEVGLLPRLSLQATGTTGESGTAHALGTGGTAGLRVSLLPAEWDSTHLVVAAGYLRELSGGNGAWGRASLQQDVGRARFAGTVHGEHVFAQGRDSVDVMVILGTSYRVAGPLRLGVEYVGQDLEETLDDQAEGGPRHFVGPTAAVRLLGERLSVVGGPSFGLARAPSVLGRVAVAYSF
jgi:hypothetical protein